MLTCEKLKRSFWRMKKFFFRILEHFRTQVFSSMLSVKFLNSVDPQRFEMQWKKTKSLVTVCLNSWFTPSSPSFSRKRINVANDLFRQFAEINECSRTMACDSPFKLDFLIHWTSLVGLQERNIQNQNEIGMLKAEKYKNSKQDFLGLNLSLLQRFTHWYVMYLYVSYKCVYTLHTLL